MALSPNDEEVANSSKKHTRFKTRVHKPYSISDQIRRNLFYNKFMIIINYSRNGGFPRYDIK